MFYFNRRKFLGKSITITILSFFSNQLYFTNNDFDYFWICIRIDARQFGLELWIGVAKTMRKKYHGLNASFDLSNLIKIKEAYVNQGPVMKRFRAASMGRASKLRRPTSHLTIILTTD